MLAASQKDIVRFAPIAAFAVMAIALAFALQNDPRKMPSMLIDRPMPTFALPPLEPGGDGLQNSDLAGQIALVNVFASWCPECKVEHPTLLRLSRDASIPLFGVNWKDKPGDGMKWLKKERSPYRRVGDDRNGRLGIDLGVTGVPETFVVDGTGRIRYRHAGPITDDVWHDTFEPLLASLGGKK